MTSQRTFACVALPLLLAGQAANAIQPASADPVRLWQGGTALLSVGSTDTASFDSSLLFDPTRQRIGSATLTLNFIGGEQRALGSQTSTVTASGGGFTAYDFVDHYVDSIDTAAVLVGGVSGQATASSVYYESSTLRSSAGVGYWTTTCAFIIGCRDHYTSVGTNRFIDEVTGYKGSFSSTTTLGADAISRWASDGLLRYGFTVGQGGVQLSSAELSFTTTPVPEPSAAMLMGAGLFGLMAWRSRRPDRSAGTSLAGALGRRVRF